MAKKKEYISIPQLSWLEDAPLFIDSDQVDRFYDAVLQPEAETDAYTLQLTESKATEIGLKLGIEASAEFGNWLTNWIAKLTGKVKAEVEGKNGKEKDKSITVSVKPVSNSLRKLKLITVHYLANHYFVEGRKKRLFFVDVTESKAWKEFDVISESPRELVFIDLPGDEEADLKGLPRAKLIPMAAEFEDGAIELFFTKISAADGSSSPPYPERSEVDDYKSGGEVQNEIKEVSTGLNEERRKYWQWFDKHFRLMEALRLVEKAGSQHGKIWWIDYRVPITKDGDTMHLHFVPNCEYHTGVFAYNMIRRGNTHGLRLVGTLKSGPDINVLAIFEK